MNRRLHCCLSITIMSKRIILSVALLCALHCSGQVPVYKIGDLLSRISHPDTTYVVNFWATWCKPCIKELPSFDSVHVKHHRHAVRVLLVSVDFVEDLNKRVVPFLKSRSIASQCVLLDEVNGNDYINKVSPQWSGAIPATMVIKAGKRVFAEKSLVMAELEHMIGDARKP